MFDVEKLIVTVMPCMTCNFVSFAYNKLVACMLTVTLMCMHVQSAQHLTLLT